PGSSFLEKEGTFTNAERRISMVRKVMPPLGGYADWEVTQLLSNALGYPMNYAHPREIMAEIPALTPTFARVPYEQIERHGSVHWPRTESRGELAPVIMHVGRFGRGKGRFLITKYVASLEKITQRYPLILTTGRILSQYNVGAQTRRTPNSQWHSEDRLEIHPHDAEDRGIQDGDWVGVASRAGDTVLRALVSERIQPGVVYTTFHFPESGANVITTDSSDWATNCPEYKVTAVQVMPVARPSAWQQAYSRFNREQLAHLEAASAAVTGKGRRSTLRSLRRPAGARRRCGRHAGTDVTRTRTGWARECRLALEYKGISQAVMLATPADLEEFALGFSLTEEIVGTMDDVRDIELAESELGITVRLEIASACFARLKERRRSL